MSTPRFVHLRLHTEYSLIDSVIRIDALFEKAKIAGMPALALTDHHNLFATIKFYKEALAQGIKPIIGADLTLRTEEKLEGSITLFCQNKVGFKNLSTLMSKAYTEGQDTDGKATIALAWLTPEHTEGLIAFQNYQSLLALFLGKSSHKRQEYIDQLQTCFPDRWYLELSRTGKAAEKTFEPIALNFAATHHIPLVATNDVRFLEAEDFEAHEARVAIHEGAVLTDSKRPKHYTEEQYLRSEEEMLKLFSDLPSALANTVEIAKRCNFNLSLGESFLPNYPTGELSTEAYLREHSRAGLEKRLQDQTFDEEKKATYWARLETELNVIMPMGFAGYFLIVADFIAWSKNNGIPVGPGRGSGAGSLVAYALGITDLDPLPYDLLFERFLNPERVSMPDFDIDFCMDGRDRVIDYVAQKYGKASVSQIITYGSMAAKAVVRDVGRVLGYPYGFVDKIAKLIPFELGITLDKAMEQEAELRRRHEEEEDVKTLMALALKLEGLVRNAGKHAGGVVIAPSQLTDFTPLYCEAGGANLVSQFDKDDVEAVGLVKFDFLGLRTLTIIDWAIKNITETSGITLDITKIPLNDEATYQLLKKGQTTAVFQLESRGMKDLIKRLKPDCFEDIIALVALFRPGPLQSGMVDDFIQRKHGIAKIEYPHPDLEPILKPTYGIILYQEQVMQIAQVLAGYTLGAADLLRRAMGKKKPEEMAKQRTIFVTGAKARSVDEKTSASIFDLMEKFAGYGFNKSHSAAYALLSYQTAWLKTHYPAEFMAAVLSSDMDNTDKVVNFIQEVKEMGLTLIAPDIHRSAFKFTVIKENDTQKILYGLGAIKGAGEAALSGVIEERKLKPYKNLFDFCERNDLRKLNKRVLEALVKSGAMDSFGETRATLWASLDKACQHADQKAASALQSDLFGGSQEEIQISYTPASEPWSLTEVLQGEKETLGWYLSGHPLTAYAKEVAQYETTKIAQLAPQAEKTIRVLAQLTQCRILMTKRGDRIAIATLEDDTGSITAAFYSEELEKYRTLLQEGEILLISGIVENDNFTQGIRISGKKITSLADAREHSGKALIMLLEPSHVTRFDTEEIKKILQQHPGNFPVRLRYQTTQGVVDAALGNKWYIKPCDALMQALAKHLPRENIFVA